jgi:hypothetical protein
MRSAVPGTGAVDAARIRALVLIAGAVVFDTVVL